MKFDRSHCITVPTTREIRSEILAAIERLNMYARYKGEAVDVTAFYNAIFFWLTTLSDDELRDFIIPKLQDLEYRED